MHTTDDSLFDASQEFQDHCHFAMKQRLPSSIKYFCGLVVPLILIIINLVYVVRTHHGTSFSIFSSTSSSRWSPAEFAASLATWSTDKSECLDLLRASSPSRRFLIQSFSVPSLSALLFKTYTNIQRKMIRDAADI